MILDDICRNELRWDAEENTNISIDICNVCTYDVNSIRCNFPSKNDLVPNFIWQHHELERLAIHESKNLEGSQRATLGRSLAVIGERDRAVRLLLDADASNHQFYTDCLRACLLAATHHSAQAQSTIKLVATNLIAAGNIWEGEQVAPGQDWEVYVLCSLIVCCEYPQNHYSTEFDDMLPISRC